MLAERRNPLVQVLSNEDLDKKEQQEYEARFEIAKPLELTGLAAYVRSCFQEAENHKATEITPRLLACQRQRLGIYDPERLSEIKLAGGNTHYFNITGTKCDAAQSWLMDIMLPPGSNSWELKPTPLPEIPTQIGDWVKIQAVEYFSDKPYASMGDVIQYARLLRNKMQDKLGEEAEIRCEKMQRTIEDQLHHGRFRPAVADLMYNYVTYPTAIFKGPVLRARKTETWSRSGELVSSVVPRLEWYAPSVYDIFPSPTATNCQDGYLCEVISLSPRSLAQMRGVDGWSAESIDKVLEEYEGGTDFMEIVCGDPERFHMENRDYLGKDRGKEIRGVEFWGEVEGGLLAEWGVKIKDKSNWYSASVILIGAHVVRAVVNPDNLDRRPYYSDSFERVPDSFWGRGLPEKMRDCQDGYNAALRNMLDNFAFCSGPMVGVDVDALDDETDPTDLYARKVFQFHGALSNGRLPIEFFQPNSNSRELIAVAESFAKEADDRTMIPRFAHGNEDVGGAGQTASGLSMLMNSAAKGIKRLAASLDEHIFSPNISVLNSWNNRYNPDPSIKGDVVVVPRGVLAALVREQTQMKQMEFLQATLNPTDSQIIGLRGRVRLLREYIKTTLGVDPDRILPDEETMDEREMAPPPAPQRAPQQRALQQTPGGMQMANVDVY